MSISAPINSASVTPGWLRGASFDLKFIVGIPAVALASGWAVVQNPDLFLPILLADLWLLGYHHVVATYTRLCFDKESFEKHRFLVIWLPFLVIGAVTALAFGAGFWTLATIYFYWQWFHYTRQSFGVSQVYRRKADGLVTDDARLSKLIFYALPAWGILHRSHQDPGTFLDLELKVIAVPAWAVDAAALVALATLVLWLGQRLWMWWQGRLPIAHTLYMLSHFTIFYVGYILMDSIDFGWLVVNIWHNAQYIVFVWLFNRNRFKDGVDPKARFLSKLSQNEHVVRYVAVCLGLATVAYLLLGTVVASLLPVIVIYQAINFHHYIVDSMIWKVRRKSLQQTLGLNRT